MRFLNTFLTFYLTLHTAAQSLTTLISTHPTLSNFTTLYTTTPSLHSFLEPPPNTNSPANAPITFLAPSNTAFTAYESHTGTSLFTVPISTLLELLQYHTLVTNLSANDFSRSAQSGLSIPTFLTTPQYNNRTVGPAMASKYGGPQRAAGQVVFVKSADSGSQKRFLLSTRQGAPTAQTTIRSGLSSTIVLKTLDDTASAWDNGRMHIVDALLTPPTKCAATIRSAKLTDLDRAFNRSGLWTRIDGSANMTCLGPSNQAFKNAGSPDALLNASAIGEAVLFHTLPEVAYADFLADGLEFTSLQGGRVRVRVEGVGSGRSVWFNNARVVDANVLTHNGLMHVLDAVMVPLDQMNGTANATVNGSPTSTPSATAAPTGTTESPANKVVPGVWKWPMWLVLAPVIMLSEGPEGCWPWI